MPRTLAMMFMSPLVGRMYNRVQPAFIVGFGVLLFSIGSYQLSKITADTSSTEMLLPLIVTGAAFACLFVPLTTAALSKIERHLMADAAGLNSFIRQVGGSVGLTIFATLFTNYITEARAGIATHVTMLRPEIAERFAMIKGFLVSHGVDAASAQLVAGKLIGGAVYQQATVLSFDRVFLLQGLLFLGVLPLLFLVRVPRTTAPVHVEMPAE
jgi:DHA2 family multidrug resistance protein